MRERITSTANPRIKSYAALHKRRERDATTRFLVEGRRELARSLEVGIEFDAVLWCPQLGDSAAAELVAVAESGAGLDVLDLSEAAFRKVSVRQSPDGLIGVARCFSTELGDVPLGPRALVLIVEAVEKPGNLGAMLRTADAAGADAVVVADPATDVFNPNVVRASQGSLFALPVGVGSAAEVLSWASAAGLRLFAAVPDEGVDYWDADLTHPTGIIVGAEHAGLSHVWEGTAQRVTIPMRPTAADSLNAATAASLVLYEALRQRR